MASVAKRRDGRFEIRESISTSRGPRSVTLAVFRELSTATLDAAKAKAKRPFDAVEVRRRAIELGAAWIGPSSAEDVRRALAGLAAQTVPPTFAAALRESTRSVLDDLLDTIEPMLHWIGKTDAERGEALRQLIKVGETIMRSTDRRRTGPLTYPVLARVRHADVA